MPGSGPMTCPGRQRRSAQAARANSVRLLSALVLSAMQDYRGHKATLDPLPLSMLTEVESLQGEIDVYTAPNLKDAIMPLVKVTGQQVLVDCQKVTYLDSTGLGVFIAAF